MYPVVIGYSSCPSNSYFKTKAPNIPFKNPKCLFRDAFSTLAALPVQSEIANTSAIHKATLLRSVSFAFLICTIFICSPHLMKSQFFLICNLPTNGKFLILCDWNSYLYELHHPAHGQGKIFRVSKFLCFLTEKPVSLRKQFAHRLIRFCDLLLLFIIQHPDSEIVSFDQTDAITNPQIFPGFTHLFLIGA